MEFLQKSAETAISISLYLQYLYFGIIPEVFPDKNIKELLL